MVSDRRVEGEENEVNEIIDHITKPSSMDSKEIDSMSVLRHKFWDTQPVPKLATSAFEAAIGPIDATNIVENVRKDPFPLPPAFEWITCDVSKESELQEIYSLLNENYVEDEDSLFRFDYSADFLRWALTPHGFKQEWHIGIRAVSSKKLVAFITGIPARISVHGTVMDMAEINFLCVHKKLRSKRLAPVLIKEITRRVNICGIWQAAYTAGVFIPRPVASCRYYHRSLNVKKLVEIGFSRLAPRMTLGRTIKLFKTLESTKTEGFRAMKESDLNQVFDLFNKKLEGYKLHPCMSVEEAAHWLVPRKGVVYTYVVEKKGGIITDFASFYSLPSSVLGNEKHSTLFAAYQFWTCANTVAMSDLTNDVFVKAREEGFDVFNALDLMENKSMFEPLKFGVGDGLLHYYLYNYKCGLSPMKPSDIGLILL